MGKSIWDMIAPVAGGILGSTLLPGIGFGISALGGGAIGSGIGSGVATGAETGNPLAGLVSGVAGGAGSYLGGSLLGPTLSGLGSSASNVAGAEVPGMLGQTAGQTFGNFAGNILGDQTLGTMAGSSIGNAVGSSLGSEAVPTGANNLNNPTAFSPSRSPQMGIPQSLSQFSSLDPFQQATNIASKGVYGGGNGPQENSYFLNLINRQLTDGGQPGNTNSINPVEGSYLNQLGLGGYGGSAPDLLKSISQYGSV